jgi:hypothetical protein
MQTTEDYWLAADASQRKIDGTPAGRNVSMQRLLRNRWILLGTLTVFLLGFIAFLPLVLPTRGTINRTKFEMIEIGMTYAGAKALLSPLEPAQSSIESNRLYVLFSEDKVDHFPPGDWIWIELDTERPGLATRTVLAKYYCRPEYSAFWEHAINRVYKAVGRTPPFSLRLPMPSDMDVRPQIQEQSGAVILVGPLGIPF